MKFLLAGAALLLATESTTAVGDFAYYEKQDPISDNLIAAVVATNDDASLFVGCNHDRGKTIYVVLETRRFLTNSVIDPSPRNTGNAAADIATLLGGITGDTFLYRVDKGESHSARSHYTGIQSAFIEGRDARALAERLASGQSIFIRVEGVNGYIDVSYDIAGIRPLLKRVAEKCGDTRFLKRLSRN